MVEKVMGQTLDACAPNKRDFCEVGTFVEEVVW